MKTKTRKVPKVFSLSKSELTGAQDPLEVLLRRYIDQFIANNQAAKVVAAGLKVIGIGFRPVIDHMTFRTLDVDERAKEFQKYGYRYDTKLEIINYEHWWAKVYRKPGYPTLFIDQAFQGKRGGKSVIPDWVNAFGDKMPHHVAIQVDDIEAAVFYLEKQGIPFEAKILGDKNTDVRQAFTKPEMRNKKIFTVLELIERHRGNTFFLPPQTDGAEE